VGTGAFHIIDPSVLYLMVKVFEREIMRPSCISQRYIAFTTAMLLWLRLCYSGLVSFIEVGNVL
jgi:hypothetical protein